MAAAAILGSSALSAYGDIQQGQMTSASLNKQADNLMSQAKEAEAQGQYDALKSQIVSGNKIGASVAAYGANGVSNNSGSALSVIQASNQNAEMDRLNILHGADVKAINYQNQAAMDRFGGQSAVLGSYFKAIGSLTGGLVKGGQMGNAAKPGGGEGSGLEGEENSALADEGYVE